MEKKITIRDVAKHAGVSVASVSNVLNNKNKMSEQTKKKILDSISILEYEVNFTARSLSNKKSNLIGVVLPISSDEFGATVLLKDNPYFSMFLNGVETACRKENYDILLTDALVGKEPIKWINKRNVDGLIYIGFFQEDTKKILQQKDIPFIVTDNYTDVVEGIKSIVVDEVNGGYLATKHLLSLGHKNIAICGYDLNKISSDGLRLQGYKMALEYHNIEFKEDLVIEAGEALQEGVPVVKKILDMKINVTAIFCLGDILAIGVIKELTRLGYNVPDDYSVVGFDDQVICKYITPELTTIRQDIFRKGLLAGEAIIEAIEGNNKITKDILPVELVTRGTTKKIK